MKSNLSPSESIFFTFSAYRLLTINWNRNRNRIPYSYLTEKNTCWMLLHFITFYSPTWLPPTLKKTKNANAHIVKTEYLQFGSKYQFCLLPPVLFSVSNNNWFKHVWKRIFKQPAKQTDILLFGNSWEIGPHGIETNIWRWKENFIYALNSMKLISVLINYAAITEKFSFRSRTSASISENNLISKIIYQVGNTFIW